MESFRQGYRLQEGDLETVFRAKGLTYPPGLTRLYSPYWVRYELEYYHPSEARYLRIGPLNRIPESVRLGIYRANFIVGDHWTPGTYRIGWKYRVSDAAPEQSFYEEFEIVSRGVDSSIFVILFCQRDLPARVVVLQESFDLPGEFVVVPSFFLYSVASKGMFVESTQTDIDLWAVASKGFLTSFDNI